MLPYRLKVQLLKTTLGNRLWNKWMTWRGYNPRGYYGLYELIHRHAPGHSFVDVGCMWIVNGDYAFAAEESGATIVKGVDVTAPTSEFQAKLAARNSSVQFILGDATQAETLENIGKMDVVFCAGVLYHHPSPFDLLVALRRICGKTLILRTCTIPEIRNLPNAAVYYPELSAESRAFWDLRTLGITPQAGITYPFAPDEGYGNWFWGLTPSCLKSLLKTAGFRVDWQYSEPFYQTLVCTPIDESFSHRLPNGQT
jgi:SAM-dependent methyltransferase